MSIITTAILLQRLWRMAALRRRPLQSLIGEVKDYLIKGNMLKLRRNTEKQWRCNLVTLSTTIILLKLYVGNGISLRPKRKIEKQSGWLPKISQLNLCRLRIVRSCKINWPNIKTYWRLSCISKDGMTKRLSGAKRRPNLISIMPNILFISEIV